MTKIDTQPAAGNGLLDRRVFLRAGFLGGAALLTAEASAVEREPWMTGPGVGMSESGAPSSHEAHLVRGPDQISAWHDRCRFISIAVTVFGRDHYAQSLTL